MASPFPSSEPRRRVHLAGSLPRSLAPDVASGMRWVLDHAGSAELSALPCDLDPNWIVDYLLSRARVPGLEVAKPGDGSCYAEMPLYRVRAGHRLTVDDIALGRPREAVAAVAARREIGADLPVQISVPSSLDLAIFTVGMAQLPRVHAVFEQMVISEVVRIAQRHRTEVTFQLESPAALCALHRVPPAARPATARLLAHQLARIITAAPRSARWTLHLCYGDLCHRALFQPSGLRPAVQVINALAARLRTVGHPVPAVHIPMAHGDQPPPASAAAYVPLRDLARGVEVIAGCVDEGNPELSARALRHTEAALGQPVAGVGAACGHGRRTAEQTRLNLELAGHLARSSRLPAGVG
ncbi:hypothetical protein SAMN02982929_01649 [Saccharopolyspora kobensis]|uniref:Methionine synthase n=2 Tax=Saccharopolyspora kobensis TaxID=146035 RepID=A0A1H5XV00_9PSEU|nr:hypothetical protein [Saccharopolyspora kobensis]SEG15483.1 hypothetical protein SAMN02982929_01649 [Saccharopolyspora kobensis]SFF11112.1 hypothetical protein SAMN05216506_11993 [Saccharopolyspora kobensis]